MGCRGRIERVSHARVLQCALGKARPYADSAGRFHGLVASWIDTHRVLVVTKADLLQFQGMSQSGGAQPNHH